MALLPVSRAPIWPSQALLPDQLRSRSIPAQTIPAQTILAGPAPFEPSWSLQVPRSPLPYRDRSWLPLRMRLVGPSGGHHPSTLVDRLLWPGRRNLAFSRLSPPAVDSPSRSRLAPTNFGFIKRRSPTHRQPSIDSCDSWDWTRIRSSPIRNASRASDGSLLPGGSISARSRRFS